MKLDPRIKSLSDIITCFDEDIPRAKNYVGQIGYFSDDLMEFDDLESCTYGKLEDCSIYYHYPFRCSTDDIDHAFFIPESVLKPKPKEKNYRPFTLMEFEDKFTVGRPIKFREKGREGCERYLILNGYMHEQREGQTFTYIYIGISGYTLDELFNAYEWQEHYTEDFKPFGVEVEE